jgi:preprotein translocase SecE subunit
LKKALGGVFSNKAMANTFLQDTKKELKYVKWLTGKQVMNFTLLVVVLSLIVAYMLGAFDFIFELGLTKLIVG